MNERVSSRLDLAELRRLLEANPAAHLSGVYRAHGKRALDVAMVLIAIVPTLLILLPLMGLIALDGRAPIYTQKRIGQNGRLFRMFKLRQWWQTRTGGLRGGPCLSCPWCAQAGSLRRTRPHTCTKPWLCLDRGGARLSLRRAAPRTQMGASHRDGMGVARRSGPQTACTALSALFRDLAAAPF